MLSEQETRLPVLVVDDDADIRESLALVFDEAGYRPVCAAALDEALALIDTATFALIVTDVFSHERASERALAPLVKLRDHAFPTPVGIVSAWKVSPAETTAQGFAFLVAKPFDIDELITTCAAAIATPFTPRETRRAQVVQQYFTGLTAGDWDGVAELCTEDVTYVLPGTGPFSTVIQGKAAFRAFTADTFAHFPGARFDGVRLSATPHGLAARYRSSWPTGDGGEHSQAGAVVFTFNGTSIRQIGVRLNAERLHALLRVP